MANPKKKTGAAGKDADIFQPPKILREPSSRQLPLGEKIVMQVVANGNPLPSFQWYHNGKKIAGAMTNRLVVQKTRQDSAGTYHCEVSNLGGTVMTRGAMITFLQQSLPQELKVEPKSASVASGQPHRFYLFGMDAESLREMSLQWLFNGKKINGATGPVLEFSEVKKKYEGEYKLYASMGSVELFSAPVYLSVKEASKTEEPVKEEPAPAPPDSEAPAFNQEDAFFCADEEEGEALEALPSLEIETAPQAAAPVSPDDFIFAADEEEEVAEPIREPLPQAAEASENIADAILSGSLDRKIPAEDMPPALGNDSVFVPEAPSYLGKQKAFLEKMLSAVAKRYPRKGKVRSLKKEGDTIERKAA